MNRTFLLCLLIPTSCAWLPGHSLPTPYPPLTVLVGPVTMTAPVTSPSDLYTVEQPHAPETASHLLAQLIEETEVSGQRLLTEQMTRQSGFIVIPFTDARRLQTNDPVLAKSQDLESLRALGRQAQADVVLTGHIVDYGVVRWQYWVPGLLVSMLTETLIVGAASGFNPVIMAATAGSELLTDLPVWWGGAYVAGWALRPVRVKVEAWPVQSCVSKPWKEEAVVVLIPGWTLKKISEDERRRKEVQLSVNLSQAMTEIADNAGRTMRFSPCTSPELDGREDTP